MQYRDLKPFEVVLEGDEYQDIDKEWRPSVAWKMDGRQNWAYPYRRPLGETTYPLRPQVTIKEYKQDDNEGYVLLSHLAEGGWEEHVRRIFHGNSGVEYRTVDGTWNKRVNPENGFMRPLNCYRVPEDVAARYVTARERVGVAKSNENMEVYIVTQPGPGVVWPEGMSFGPPIEEHKPEPETPKIVGVDLGNAPDKSAAVVMPPKLDWHDTVIGIRKALIGALNQLRDMETMYSNLRVVAGQTNAKLRDSLAESQAELVKIKNARDEAARAYVKDLACVTDLGDKQGQELGLIRKRCTDLEMECQALRRKLNPPKSREQAAAEMKENGL
jgi:hypothetical protein